MRQLTASQKIAVLEHRIAKLEKQAFLEGLKAKIAEAMEPFKRLLPQTKKVIKDTRKSPKQLAKEYMKISKKSDFKKAMKQLQREAGSSPVKQVAYVVQGYKSGELEQSGRRASMRRRASIVLSALAVIAKSAGIAGSIMAVISIADICFQWVSNKVKGIFKSSSMDKEASTFVLVFIILWLTGAIEVDFVFLR